MLTAIITGRPLDPRVETWLSVVPEDLKRRLERAELVENVKIPTLGELFDAYIETETRDFKPSTVFQKKWARRRFFEYFSENTLSSEITKRDAANFAADLSKTKLSEASRAGTIRDVKTVFSWALKTEILTSNPFEGIKSGSFKNKKREVYVSLDDYRKMLAVCPSQAWRALLALYRIGGLRKGEALTARWRDVDFPGGRLLVHSPKTERYDGHETRVVPLFPELRQELEKLWDELPEGAPDEMFTFKKQNVWVKFEQIVFQAGLNQWDRMIQNLRSSRAIEIEREFGAIAESQWLGHSPKTAKDHYLHVLEEDFERATRTTAKTTARRAEIKAF